MNITDFVNEWLGVPFKHRGRDKDGVDCYGILVRFFDGVIYLPDTEYERDWSKDGADYFREHLRSFSNQWEKVAVPAPGDVVLFRGAGGAVNHCGIVVDRARFIHAAEQCGVVVSHFSGRYEALVYGYFRLKTQ